MFSVLPIESIVSDPAVKGGRPVIVGTRIRVQDVAAARAFHPTPQRRRFNADYK